MVQKNIKEIENFCNIFDLVVQVELDDEVVLHHCLFSGYDHRPDSPRISSKDLAAFLEQVRYMKVTLSEPCSSLLTGYFLASRRCRPGSSVPQTALATLIKMAEAHARLALRWEVVEEDGVAACHFYEISLAAQFGHSLLEPPSFNFSSMAEVVGDGALEEMQKFHRLLTNNISHDIWKRFTALKTLARHCGGRSLL